MIELTPLMSELLASALGDGVPCLVWHRDNESVIFEVNARESLKPMF